MPHVKSNEIEIAYDDLGRDEPALLLLPGWCANRSVFRSLALVLAQTRRTLVLDWRGHGESGRNTRDFGEQQLVDDARAVIEASAARRVIPVALSHTGWVALELRRRLGRRIPALVLLDWILVDPPQPFFQALDDMQSSERWREAVEGIFASWLHGTDNPDLENFVRGEMGAYGFDMWSRAAREIRGAYARDGNPLAVLETLTPSIPVLHLYAQPDAPEYLNAQKAFAAGHPWFRVRKLNAQKAFAAGHPWFRVRKLNARSHFPMFEVPHEMAEAIEEFAARAGESTP